MTDTPSPNLTLLLWATAAILLLIALAAMAGSSPSSYEPVSAPLAAVRRAHRNRPPARQTGA